MSLRARDEHRKINLGDVKLGTNGLGVEYLELQERISKTRDVAIVDENRSTRPKIFCSCASSGKKKCIVEIYKEFVQRRPADYCNVNDPFYVQYKNPQ